MTNSVHFHAGSVKIYTFQIQFLLLAAELLGLFSLIWFFLSQIFSHFSHNRWSHDVGNKDKRRKQWLERSRGCTATNLLTSTLLNYNTPMAFLEIIKNENFSNAPMLHIVQIPESDMNHRHYKCNNNRQITRVPCHLQFKAIGSGR